MIKARLKYILDHEFICQKIRLNKKVNGGIEQKNKEKIVKIFIILVIAFQQ